MTKKISLIGIQTIAGHNREENLRRALALIDEAAELYRQMDVVVLPEYFYDPFDERENTGPYPEEVERALSAAASRYGTYILGGTVLNRCGPGEKLRNTSLLFDREGKVVGSYDKTHLFDALNCVGDKGESQFCEHGDHLFTWDTDFGRIGVEICYDIRFPELARTLALRGVNFLLIPSAFFSPRSDHWTDILKATAVQNSLYVVGANLFGRLTQEHVFCGRSLIVDPWGVVVAGASDKACFFQAYVDAYYAETVREATGVFVNRRPLLYDI